MSRSGSKKNRQPIVLTSYQREIINKFEKILARGEIKELELCQALSIRLRSKFDINLVKNYDDNFCKKVIKELNFM